VCGLGILTLGVIVQLRVTEVTDHIDTNLKFPAITLIVIGSVIFVISFFGCCGAIRESHCMIITFASFLLFILLVQIAIGVYAFVVVKNNDNQVDITTDYQKVFDKYNENKNFIDFVQSNLHCCGVNSPRDYVIHPIPPSCCGKEQNETCTENIYQTGCAIEIKNAISTAGTVLGSVAIAIAGVELIGIIFALCLANSIKNAERRGYRV
ncbi:CD63 antigen, partial [Melipona quadrifasciata]